MLILTTTQILTLLAAVGSLTWPTSQSSFLLDRRSSAGNEEYSFELKMVSVITRHGDRAPYASFLPGDKFASRADSFWPRGLDNLTEMGEFRQYSLGLKLRRLYRHYLSMDPGEVLALSSTSNRCVKSVEKTLQGLFNIETSSSQWNREVLKVQRTCKKPTGCVATKKGGFADSWKSININTTLVPSLDWAFLDKRCPWRQANPSQLDKNGLLDKDVARLPWIGKLREVLKLAYQAEFTYENVTDIWAQILNEMQLSVTAESLKLSEHFLEWATEPLPKNISTQGKRSKEQNSKMTLYDVLEGAALLLFRDRTQGRALRIQNGPIVTSIVDSFRVSLNQSKANLHEGSSFESYKNKKIVLYSTHDHAIIHLMNSLNLLNFGSTFEKRFNKYHDKSDFKQFVNGIRIPSYGSSIRFELLELENKKSGEKLPVVRAYLYNKEDGKSTKIHYHKLKLGKSCRKLLKRTSTQPNKHFSQYYNSTKFQIDTDYVCPFEVFEKVTSQQMITNKELAELCKL